MSRLGENDELKEVLDSIDVEGFLDREGITYKRARGSSGQQLNLKECPECGNEKWKTYLNADNGLGNCFVCEKKFNRWSFIKATQGGLSDKQVVDFVKMLAAEQGWRPPRTATAAVELKPLELPDCMPLPINDRNLSYLENRGITTPIARFFNLYYCHKGEFGGQDYSRRVIIPIFDLDGQLVSFQGRDITGIADPKYRFPAGYASTGAHLYNGQNVHNTKRVVVGEGAFDVFALKIALDGEADLRDVVPIGTFGKHLSSGGADDQFAKMMKLKALGVSEVTFMWDAEPAALAAAVEVGLLLKGYGMLARVAVLPPGKDPNEVAPAVVRRAYYQAEVITPAVGAKLRLSLGSP